MKVQIRQGVFETNSSSTHAVSVCTKEQWDAFKAGKLWINHSLKFLPAAEAEQYNNDKIAELKAACENRGYGFDREDYEYELYHAVDDDALYDTYNYEWYDRQFTLENGCDVVAFGFYGYD